MRENMKILTLIFLVALTTGCTSITATKDYDPSYEEVVKFDERRLEDSVIYTEDNVTLKRYNKVSVVAIKVSPKVTFENDQEIVQDKWDIFVLNNHYESKCVKVLFTLLDFKFISDHPMPFYINGESQLKLGTMTQIVWEINGVKFTPDGSGYVNSLEVEYPVKDALKGDECIYIIPEKHIITR
jgi:hypothetical protein